LSRIVETSEGLKRGREMDKRRGKGLEISKV
jgi:hypothetical protein